MEQLKDSLQLWSSEKRESIECDEVGDVSGGQALLDLGSSHKQWKGLKSS